MLKTRRPTAAADPPAGRKPPRPVTEVAAEHGVGWRTVIRWCETGVSVGGRRVRLAGYKAGGTWRIPDEALDAFLRACNPDAADPLPDPAKANRQARAEQAALAAALGG